MKQARREWIRETSMHVLVKEASGWVDRNRAAANFIALIDFVAEELDKRGVFDDEVD